MSEKRSSGADLPNPLTEAEALDYLKYLNSLEDRERPLRQTEATEIIKIIDSLKEYFREKLIEFLEEEINRHQSYSIVSKIKFRIGELISVLKRKNNFFTRIATDQVLELAIKRQDIEAAISLWKEKVINRKKSKNL